MPELKSDAFPVLPSQDATGFSYYEPHSRKYGDFIDVIFQSIQMVCFHTSCCDSYFLLAAKVFMYHACQLGLHFLRPKTKQKVLWKINGTHGYRAPTAHAVHSPATRPFRSVLLIFPQPSEMGRGFTGSFQHKRLT